MAAGLDDPSLMKGQCTETASAKTAPVADEAEPDLGDSRNSAKCLVGRMIRSHIRQRIDIIHFYLGQWKCRWILCFDDSSVDIGNLFHRNAGIQCLCNLDDGVFSHSVRKNIRTGI